NYEARFPQETITALEAMGHTCKKSDEWNRSFGSVNAVRYAPDGTLDGAGDPRRDGKALGF
ncbi:MAG: gamma-glutamyltransferase, partial [Oscillospiraceae bacterium]